MIKVSNPLYFSAVAIVSLGFIGCADKDEPPKSSASPQGEIAKTIDDGRAGSIVVDDEIARLCDLPTSHFPFDRSNVTAGSSPALDALVSCLSSGGLKGRSLSLVGHADPRGEQQYNFALGQRRAGSVEDYLSDHGIEGSRMTTSSRGELDATGVDLASWASDRTVEIRLAAETAD